ncbi:hypothetical protein ZIOFF_008624 [Zingiber officinale]|uniref:Uncharacterized protein n=1 Tax=Zingiber officinale TaxID=94328 RepID=A0A8J5IGL5_ZINOF|nr:hypothetical protein ZIOFF_008624 [Zingiber officinale]
MAAVKDKWSVYLIKTIVGRHHLRRRPEAEAAVVRATSHDEVSVDYKNARLTPRPWPPLLLRRRAALRPGRPPPFRSLQFSRPLLCLPFDLSDFRDRSSASPGFSAFVRTYFNFLDHRSLFSSLGTAVSSSPCATLEDDEDDLKGLERLEVLLDLPCRSYSLQRDLQRDRSIPHRRTRLGFGNADERVKRRWETGIRILRRAAAHSAQLSSYFYLCRTLGVLNAADLPRIEGIPKNDLDNLKVLMLGDAPTANAPAAEDEGKRAMAETDSATTISKKRELFDEDGHFENTAFLRSQGKSDQPAAAAATANPGPAIGPIQYGNLIDLS